MKLNIPKLTQPIPLGDYAPELALTDQGSPAVVHAWVNPPAALLNRHAELRQRGQAALERLKTDPDKLAAGADLNEVGLGLCSLFAELWSQNADTATHWTAAEVNELANSDANPALYGWLTRRTLTLISQYRSGLRKN